MRTFEVLYAVVVGTVFYALIATVADFVFNVKNATFQRPKIHDLAFISTIFFILVYYGG